MHKAHERQAVRYEIKCDNQRRHFDLNKFNVFNFNYYQNHLTTDSVRIRLVFRKLEPKALNKPFSRKYVITRSCTLSQKGQS